MALYYKPFISKVLRYGPGITVGSHSFTCHPHTHSLTYIAQANPSQHPLHALIAAINRLLLDWHWCPRGRSRWTWLPMIELHFQQHNLSFSLAWKWALDQVKWCQLVEMALSYQVQTFVLKWRQSWREQARGKTEISRLRRCGQSWVSGGWKLPMEQSAAWCHLSFNADCFSETPQNFSFPNHFLPNCFHFLVLYTMYSSGLAVLYLSTLITLM